ncbi:MAG: glycosyltransferase, partial [Verrucomicrobiota bacterium]
MRSTQWCRWAVCLLALTLMALTAQAWASIPDLHSHALLRIVLWTGFFLGGLAMFLCFPDRLRGWAAVAFILVVAVVPRALLFPAAPTNDINRYLWEGKLLRAGISPYAQKAEDPALEPYRDQFWPEINHKDRTTVYPPLTQYVFAGVGWLNYTPGALKLVFLLADFATLLLLLILLERRRAPPRWALLYALNPVTLATVAAEAHFDALLVLGLAGVLLAADARRPGLAWLLLGLAFQVKIIAVVLIPALGMTLGWRKWWWGALAATLPALPFIFDVPTVLAGLWEFGGRSSFNGSIHSVITALTGSETAASVLCGTLLLGVLWLSARLRLEFAPRAFLALGGLLLLSSVVHFWYLLWILPLLVLLPCVSWLYLTGAMGLYLLTWYFSTLGAGWMLPDWAQAVIWIPFYVLLLLELRHPLRRWWRGRLATRFPEVETVSLIVPTYNAAENMEALAVNLRALSPAPTEVLLVDGGSTDATTSMAREEKLSLIHASGGRGGQLRAGFEHTSGDAVLVLHADTRLPPDAIDAVRQALNRRRDGPGGCLGQRFDSTAPALLLVEAMNEWRATFHGTSFGDQVQFFRREAAARFEGFPDPPLMEDVELSIRLHRQGRPLYLGREATVSADKWRRTDFATRFSQVLTFMLRYHWHWRRRRELARELFRQ